MRYLLLLSACLAALGVAAGGGASVVRVAWVSDGDTIVLSNRAHVRLLQIDTPEVGSGECYSRAAARELRRLLPLGSTVRLEADTRLDRVDRYSRQLRYVWRGGVNVNIELVRRGAATVWSYDGERGKYASRLLAAARQARAERRGFWGACKAVWNPYAPATTVPKSTVAPRRGGCDPSYPTVCIPSPPPDLDCADVRYRDFAVRSSDPHRFDGDRDGRGCEP